MRTILYPGSFDPVTEGHLDIIRRAAALFDHVIVGVLYNSSKPAGAFSVEERLSLLQTACTGLENVRIQAFDGLLVEAARASGSCAVLRAVRTSADVDLEMQMARLNRQLGQVETLVMVAAPEVVHVSASMVREIGRYGGSLAGLVPESVRPKVEKALFTQQ